MKKQMLLFLTVIAISFGGLINAAAPGFSFHNKSNLSVWITFSVSDKNGKKEIVRRSEVPPEAFYDEEYNYAIDKTLKTPLLTVSDKTGKTIYAKVGFTPGKTIYVNWGWKNNKLQVHPQRGPYMGLKGITDEGYPTKNNVSEKDITIVYSGADALRQLEQANKDREKQIKAMKKR